jgi:hypothetical protein
VVSIEPIDVRFGSKADMGLPLIDVRYTPESGHSALQQIMTYSITAVGKHEQLV